MHPLLPKPLLTTAVLAALLAAAPPAGSAPVAYRYTADGVPYGNGPVAALSGGVTRGRLLYDASVPYSGVAGNGAAAYGGGVTSWAGRAGGHLHSDPSGRVHVGNELRGTDFLQLIADPAPSPGTNNLAGFDVGGQRLINVRMFWFEGQRGMGDFLADDSMPLQLPSTGALLAFDFQPIGQPTAPVSYVFFDGVTLQPVPEPPAVLLMSAGALALAWRARRRRAA